MLFVRNTVTQSIELMNSQKDESIKNVIINDLATCVRALVNLQETYSDCVRVVAELQEIIQMVSRLLKELGVPLTWGVVIRQYDYLSPT